MAMCDFGGFVPADGLPIYLQIVRYVERGVAAGTIADGEELPSRRVLSAQLGVIPNTVQKAYRLLEEAGLITSRSGAKSEVCAPPVRAEALRAKLLEQEITGFVRSLRQSGLEKEAALELIDRLWDRKEEEA